jgi:hypothetical protein
MSHVKIFFRTRISPHEKTKHHIRKNIGREENVIVVRIVNWFYSINVLFGDFLIFLDQEPIDKAIEEELENK